MLAALLPWYKHAKAWLGCMFERLGSTNLQTEPPLAIHGFMMVIVIFIIVIITIVTIIIIIIVVVVVIIIIIILIIVVVVIIIIIVVVVIILVTVVLTCDTSTTWKCLRCRIQAVKRCLLLTTQAPLNRT